MFRISTKPIVTAFKPSIKPSLIISATKPTLKPFTAVRAFHSPFAVLSSSSLKPTTPPTKPEVEASAYEKQVEQSPDPETTLGGMRTYSVSHHPEEKSKYDVPFGAYHISVPFDTTPATSN